MDVKDAASKKLKQLEQKKSEYDDPQDFASRLRFLKNVEGEKKEDSVSSSGSWFIMLPFTDEDPLAGYFPLVIEPLARKFGIKALKIGSDGFTGP